jgi:ketosteroid isomerase-like protein
VWLPIVALMLAPGPPAQAAPATAELTKLLDEFLAGASRNDAAMHDRFWAEDLIYTGSSGRRVGKADILRDVRSAPMPKPGDPKTTFSAADVRIHQYGDSAIVAFRFVGTTERDGRVDLANYLNTGTFLKRGGRWRAVAWQATRVPQPEDEAKKDAAAAQEAFHQAMLAADVKTLDGLLDESFIWTRGTGERMTRPQLLNLLGSGQLRYSKLETSDVAVAVYGDTAIVRGVSWRQRSAFPGSDGAGDASPFTAFYTLMLVQKGGTWKAAALHTSRS